MRLLDMAHQMLEEKMSTHGTIRDHFFQVQVERSKPWENVIPKKEDPWNWQLRIEIGGLEVQLDFQRKKLQGLGKRLLNKHSWCISFKSGYVGTPFFWIDVSIETGPWFHRDTGDYSRD